jgi:dTMP kinase
MAGIFIVFEGIDGAGKSSIMHRVAVRLGAEGRKVVETAEPTHHWLGEAVRRAGSEALGAEEEALLFVADRAQHTRQISKWLEEGNVVLCDRYWLSTAAYQGAALEEKMGRGALDWLRELNRPVIVKADLTILFDIDPKKSLARLTSRGEKSKFEEEAYLRRVEENYLKLVRFDRSVARVDADRKEDEVFQEVLELVKDNLQ